MHPPVRPGPGERRSSPGPILRERSGAVVLWFMLVVVFGPIALAHAAARLAVPSPSVSDPASGDGAR